MKIDVIAILFFGLFVFTNCAKSAKENETPKNEDTPGTAMPNDSLVGTYWKLNKINGKKISEYPSPNTEPHLTLNGTTKTVVATGGCNSMGGSYELKGTNQIDFLKMMSTKMACPDMTLEADFQKALEIVDTYEINGNKLTLSTRQDSTMLKFEAVDGK